MSHPVSQSHPFFTRADRKHQNKQGDLFCKTPKSKYLDCNRYGRGFTAHMSTGEACRSWLGLTDAMCNKRNHCEY